MNDQIKNRLIESYNKITIKNNTPETNSLTSPSKFSKSLKLKLHILPFVKETILIFKRIATGQYRVFCRRFPSSLAVNSGGSSLHFDLIHDRVALLILMRGHVPSQMVPFPKALVADRAP